MSEARQPYLGNTEYFNVTNIGQLKIYKNPNILTTKDMKDNLNLYKKAMGEILKDNSRELK